MLKNLKTELAHEWPAGKVCLVDLGIICTVAKQVVQINMVKERLAGGKQHIWAIMQECLPRNNVKVVA